MTPKRIILVRHGRSAANDDSTVYSRVPDYKIELVEEGREQSRTAGDRIREIIGEESYGVYVSPYVRTVQTKVHIVERIGRSPTFDYFDSRPCLPNCHIAVMTRGDDGAFALSEPFADIASLSEGNFV